MSRHRPEKAFAELLYEAAHSQNVRKMCDVTPIY